MREGEEEGGRGTGQFLAKYVVWRKKWHGKIEKIALPLCFSQLPKSADDLRIKKSRFEAH